MVYMESPKPGGASKSLFLGLQAKTPYIQLLEKHRIVVVGEDIRRSSSPTLQLKAELSRAHWLVTISSWVLSVSKDGDKPTSLSSLPQYSATLTVKRSFSYD